MKMGVGTSPCARRERAGARLAVGAVEAEAHREQHRVAVAVEAVAAGDGVVVGGEDALLAGEGGDEHDQRRARQVEVGEHDVDGAEGVAGADEDRGAALPCAHDAVASAAASSVRTTVVPTATMGLPAARVSAMARAVASGMS